MAVRGSLQDLDLLTLLQMTCEEGGDAQITLQRGVESASLYIQGGQIVHAEGQAHKGEDMVYEVLGWKDGSFALTRTVPAPAVSIQRDWNSLLLEGLRRLDEQEDSTDSPMAETRQQHILVVSDDAATLAEIRSAIAPYGAELNLTTADSQKAAIALLDTPPDVLVLAWQGPPTEQGELFSTVVAQRLPIPTIVYIQNDESKMPSVSPLNPVVFLRLPPDSTELIAAVWAQVAREATGEPVGLPLFTLCEWIRLAKHTCLIRVSTPHDEGMLAFVEGVLLNAVTGQKLGEAAVKSIFGWEGVTLEFATIGAKVKPLIERPLKAILSGTEPQPVVIADKPVVKVEDEAADKAPEPEAAEHSVISRNEDETGDDTFLTEAPTEKEEELPSSATDDSVSTEAEDDSFASSEVARSDASDSASPLLHTKADPDAVPTSVVVAPDTETLASDSIHGDTSKEDSPPLSGTEEMAQTTEDKIQKTMSEVMTINGALGVALVDITSGMALGKMGNTGLDLDIAAAGNSEVVKAKLNVMRDLGIRGEIEDILITLQNQYHLIRPLGSDSTLFLYVVLNKDTANLALARRQLSKSEAGLVM
jgi:CheY-like chemotaxis protein/ribosomal protein L12E/L44/L45/RPP1/RPP2